MNESFAENIQEEIEQVEEIEVRDELQDTFDEWHASNVSEDEIVELLHSEHGLSYPAAVNKLRVLRKGAGLVRQRGNKSAEVQQFIQECADDDMERADIIKALIDKYGYTPKSAASTFSVQGGKLGLTGGGAFGAGAKKPLSEVVAFAREHADDKRADFTAAMQEELGYTESTSGAFFTYLGFAKEYARQEIEAA